jgi:hypothetical protein
MRWSPRPSAFCTRMHSRDRGCPPGQTNPLVCPDYAPVSVEWLCLIEMQLRTSATMYYGVGKARQNNCWVVKVCEFVYIMLLTKSHEWSEGLLTKRSVDKRQNAFRPKLFGQHAHCIFCVSFQRILTFDQLLGQKASFLKCYQLLHYT